MGFDLTSAFRQRLGRTTLGKREAGLDDRLPPTGRKNYLSALAMLVLVIVVGSDSFPTAAADTGAKLRGVHYLGDLPTLVADRQGLFDAAGADLTVDYGTAGKANLAALRAGEIEFATMALTPPVIDRLRDPDPGEADDPVILANLAHALDLNHVVLLDDADAGAQTALTGGRIAVMKGTNAESLWSLFAARHGIEPGAVELVDMPVEAIPDALADGGVAAAVVWRPWTDRLRRRFGSRLTVWPVNDLYAANWVLVTRRETVARKPELVRAILRAYHRAAHRIQRAPATAYRLFGAHAGIEQADVDAFDNTATFGLSLDWSLLAGVLQQAAWARRAGYAPRDARIAPLSMMAPAPLRAVAPHNVHIPADAATKELRP